MTSNSSLVLSDPWSHIEHIHYYVAEILLTTASLSQPTLLVTLHLQVPDLQQLRLFFSCFFQLLVEACDLDRLCNTTLATVQVMRNLFAPEMMTQDSFDTIPETWAIGRTLLTATAIDRDVAVR